jgi:carbon-monoxide dehydrogenase large subunit
MRSKPLWEPGTILDHLAGSRHLEQLVYDSEGQLLTTSFMDYLLPTASEIPELEIEHMVTPTPFIPGGIKGTGEAGALAPAE